MKKEGKYQHLIKQIDAYIQKYYTNLLIKGILLSVGFLFSFFLIISLLESYFYMNSNLRAGFFFIYIAFALTCLTLWVFIPLFKMWNISKRLDRKEAALQIGAFFPDLDDKLLNTLQLQEMSNQTGVNKNLLDAVIDQRSEQFKGFSFKQAVQFSTNKRFLPFVIPILSLFIILLFAAPNLITEPTQRLINYNKEFAPEAPFSFHIINDKLEVVENDDLTLEVEMKGDEIPAEVTISIEGQEYRMKKKNLNHFYYNLENIRKTLPFHFQSEGFSSQAYKIVALPKPSILDFEIEAKYPSYTGKKNETFANIGDLIIPEGTQLKWKFETKDANLLSFITQQNRFQLDPKQQNLFEFNKNIRHDLFYGVSSSNKLVQGTDTLHYQIRVVKDAFPVIRISEYRDSLQRKHIYVKGFIKDDYGFQKLLLKYRIINPINQDVNEAYQSTVIDIDRTTFQQQFFHFLNLNELNIKSGEQVQYYFEVWDNDKINGSKSSQTAVQVFKAPDQDEIIKERNESTENIKDKMNEAMKMAKKIKKEIARIKKELAEKKNLEWSDKEEIKNVLEQNKELLNELEEIKKENQQKLEKEKEFKKMDNSILEKQQELQDLMDKLLTPEMKEMMEELQKMMEKEMKKEDAEKMLDKMDLDNEDLEKQLERDLELFKEMDFQMKMQDAIEKLDTLQKKQQELQKESIDKKSDAQEMEKKQEKLNKEFDKLEEKLDEMREANEKLEEPHDMDSTSTEEKSIKEEMEDAKEDLQKNQKKKAGQKQQSASQQMKELKEKLEKMRSSMEMEQTGEDMQMLREILDNLVETSFRQESIMKELKQTAKEDPRYPELIKEQKKLRNDMEGVEDSLMALSKRQAQIEPYVNKEVSRINRSMDHTLAELQGMNTIGYVNPRQKKQVIANQQQIMTSVNQLALLLSEALDQMQKQMAQQQSKPGSSCKNPKPGKSGKPNSSSLKKMQQNLKKQMEQMQKSMQKGKGKKGKAGENDEKMSEEMAKLAAQQEMIRRKLREYQSQLKKDGHGGDAKSLNKIAEQMEQNETDLVNKILTTESLKRQEEILSRLLEAEKAERERGEKEERKSIESKNNYERNVLNFKEYKDLKSKEVEFLKTIPLFLKPFYKNKVKQYFEGQLLSQ